MASKNSFSSFVVEQLTTLVLVTLSGVFWLGMAALAGSQQPAKSPKPAQKPKAKSVDLTKNVTQGGLRASGKGGELVECPLLHTDVKADISGFISRVKVTQTFKNPIKEKIEAVYVFPLPHEAAVDEMTMVIGERRIIGVIKPRDDAREIYQQALAAGQTAALLEQERPNIFTQSVGNIEPGQEINIEISYVETLQYDQGAYEFHFPMVVGPRYNPQRSPGQPAGARAAKINPPVLKPTQRTGHDVSLTVNLDAGVPIQNLTSANHKVFTSRKGDSKARVRLLQEDSLPNKDFVLRYEVAGDKPEMAVLAHTGRYSGDARRVGQGYFMLMIQPKEDERLTKSPPREVVFLVDVSGSMRGVPTAKVRDAMEHMIKLCREKDTMQVVTFASRANKLFDKPVPVNDENKKRALEFAASRRGGGGTEMIKGVRMAIDEPIDKVRVRIIVMLTDGYIGNEAQIIKHVGENCGDQIRFWAIGIGASPNMFLIDGVARQGGGMGKKLGLKDKTANLTTEVMTRIQRAQLAGIQIDWGDLHVAQTFPAKIPELWAGRPVIVYGRYKDGGASEITVRGRVEGEDASWPLQVAFPKEEKEHDVLAKVWARQKIEDLMHQTYYQGSPAIEEEVTAIALNYRLMSQYTSFVAVDAKKAKELAQEQSRPARPPRRMTVPVPLPEGTQWEGFFGEGGGFGRDGERLLVEYESLREVRERQAVVRTKALDSLSQLNRASARPAKQQIQRLADLQQRISGFESAYRLQRAPTPQFKRMRSSERRLSLARSASELAGRGPARRYGGAAYSFDGRSRGGVNIALANGTVRFLNEALDNKQTWRRMATPQFAHSLISGHRKQAEAALARAKTLQKDKRSAGEIRAALTRAYLLDLAAASAGGSDGKIADEALSALEEQHQERVKAAVKATPALDKKLDLILRDQLLEEALAKLSQAGGLPIRSTPGSLEDARKLLFDKRARITFLDLRRATLAQALDWIVQPLRMQWSLKNGGAEVMTARRADGVSAWIYDVSLIAAPSDKETKDQKNPQQTAQKQASEFLAAVRKSLKADADSVLWFGPGQLLVFGDRDLHQKAGKLLKHLADPRYQPSPELVKLHALTSQRAAHRKEQLQKSEQAQRHIVLAQTLDQFGWPLLASAAGGKLDLEALTELQIAWRDPQLAGLLSGEGSELALTSLWKICSAAAALPQEQALQQLAVSAIQRAGPSAEKALASLKEKPDDPSAFARVLYASLAHVRYSEREDSSGKDYLSASRPLLTKERKADSPLASLAQLAGALLDDPTEKTSAALAKLVDGGARGNELVALTALASRRAGGEVWRRFRAQSRQLLGEQPLRGEVVLLVNRL